ncbi:MAG: methionyl-tRNA formyltransferase [Opitutales bacterium]|nr:methionyl-tRNA formyltransferase [Opitutales bacterium]
MGEVKRVVFMGSDAIALPTLRLLAEEESVELVGVFTQPDRPAGRGNRLRSNPIKEWGVANGLMIHEPEKPGETELVWLQERNVELVIVMAYGHLLRPSLLEAVAGRYYNLHASLLPAYRGASPVETALAEGEKFTGVSLMRIVSKMDAGPVVDREEVPIKDSDDGSSLREKLALACVPLLNRNLGNLLAGRAKEQPQDDNAASYCRLLRKEDGRLDFTMQASRLTRRVAAFRAWPGCFFEVGSVRVKVGGAGALMKSVEAPPGEVLGERDGALEVATGEGVLALRQLQRPGGKMLATPEFLRGFSLPAGTKLAIDPALPLVARKPSFFSKNEKTG